MKNTEQKIPALRFPEFSGEWEEKRLRDIIISQKLGGNYTNTEASNNNPLIKMGNLDRGFIKLDKIEYIKDGEIIDENDLLKYGDLLFNTRNTLELVGKVAIWKGELDRAYYNSNILRLEFENNFFMNALFNTSLGLKALRRLATGTTSVAAIYTNDLIKLEVLLPSLPEQQKIADFLSAIDKRLQLLKDKKTKLEEYKRGVMQRIFSQELRFTRTDGSAYPDWVEKRLEEVLFEHKSRNSKLEVDEVFSVAKEKGVINQIEHLGRSYAADDISNYKVVYPFDIIYTKSPTSGFPFGIIKQNKTNRTGVVSTLYGVFRPTNKFLGYYLDAYFSSEIRTYNYLVPLVQKGAKNTMNINNETFLNGASISLPSSEDEQRQIADFLSAIDDKISLLSKQIASTEQYKKGLLQQMFV
ncbi:restriction endonuclease subunit S [Dysgonomonas massiliensis]|uniref:restriction endonuclease subunit S n=1 Tax=Dysgonomonas massiliensis TaxID=2040292 RepID=UPI00135940BB|nr:restriction endonuclease subunit S [Dysgonomonas massiliensis]